MSRKFNPVSAALALAFLLLAASAASAQGGRIGPSRAVEVGPAIPAQGRVATLGCCKCLGGTNTLDLSTIPSNAWTVNNGSPVSFLTSIHPLWDINPGAAKWVSTAANGGTGSIPAGTSEYRMSFFVPECTIGQSVTLTGNVGGDDGFQAFLDNPAGLLAQCNTGWCFNKGHVQLQTFTKTVVPGPHMLIVRVDNGGGPSGMFVNATLTGACRRE
jgi:hypothetical protein